MIYVVSHLISVSFVKMAETMPSCVPGDRLGHTADYRSGAGTYVRQGHIYASLVGRKTIMAVGDEASSTSTSTSASAGGRGSLPTLSVVRPADALLHELPAVGSVVTGRVMRINARFAQLDIICCADRPFKGSFEGLIRRENVRSTEIDRVEIFKSFRPGDVVRAEVLSLGDAKSYYLSTANVNLGVTMARSETAGVPMIPVSWEQMQCPITQEKEYRKVAKQQSTFRQAYPPGSTAAALG